MSIKTNVCNVCNIEKPLDSFYYIKPEKRYNRKCRECSKAAHKEDYELSKIRQKIKVINKVCIRCEIQKDISEFNKQSKQKDGYANMCKECYRDSQNQYRENYRPEKPYIKPNHKVCNSCHLELPFEKYCKHVHGKFGLNPRCKNCLKKQKKPSTTEYKAYANEKAKKRKKEDIGHKLKCLLRGRINGCLKRNLEGAASRFTSSQTLLGCTIEEYKLYLESLFLPEMTWANHGETWEIDHIEAIFTFNLINFEEQKKCFNYKNTRPLFKTTQIAESLGYKGYIGNRDREKLDRGTEELPNIYN